MTQEEKQLLLIDLCARLLYGVQVCYKIHLEDAPIDVTLSGLLLDYFNNKTVVEIKPYLRPMSSMTEEEILELYKIAYTTWYSDSLYYKYEEWITFRDSIQNNTLCFKSSIWLSNVNKVIDWLNSHHFDYRGLIKKGLALEAPEGMYKTN